ncbi:hypothetical protein D3OALGA1CA_3558 [Olavius algarvensis associated proteobacterium Delta 3]|nr:hypothetical protein D3OALGB2SA_2315 [Olavius algarvensis associated proteobacterium Delta 3]CAB5136241.1 hypothetical protein D3OALGA1CA_3558 [Olavius algarvensis associated proteobacterium Delta 3]
MDKEKKPASIRHRRWIVIISLAVFLIGIWQLFAGHYGEEEKEVRRHIRETVKKTFPEQTAKFSTTFGLSFVEVDGTGSRPMSLARNTVVLIHGLDDPGKVWRSLAPVLVEEDYNVYKLAYPNDQPVVESARFFFGELKKLKQLGIDRIFIVGHSMGGLVSREMLTRPDIGYEAAARNGMVPGVASLIMVGTPNHGSQMARFRVFSEMRDQLGRIAKGESTWLGGILDGAGEAKIDLLPESRFLTELNARPHPEGLDMLVIAGITSPWNETDINGWISSLRQKLPEDLHGRVDELSENMIAMTHGLGDGLVTVDSARLEGVPLRTVDGTHLSIIRNITKDSRRIPPAVPIILSQIKSFDDFMKRDDVAHGVNE